MAKWGRNDQAATANSTTTTEISSGAPTGIFSLVKGGTAALGANAHFGNTSPGTRASIDVGLFNNTTPGAFVNNIVNKSTERPAHAGWNFRRAGTGPIISFSYTGTATGYNNTDVITVASPQAGGNATVSLVTNSTGGALVLTVSNVGAGFTSVNCSSLVSIANSTGGATAGSGATWVAIAGGRAGRVHTETLIAMGTIGTNTTTSTGASGSSNTVTDASTDNTQYPGL